MTEQQLKIYEVMADKTLSCGCRVIVLDKEHGELEYIYGTFSSSGDFFVADDGCSVNIMTRNKAKEIFENEYINYEESLNQLKTYFHKIIGHSVNFGDVYDFLENINGGYWVSGNNPAIETLNQKLIDTLEKLTDLWEDKRKPIENQPQDCQDFVYSLIKE